MTKLLPPLLTAVVAIGAVGLLEEAVPGADAVAEEKALARPTPEQAAWHDLEMGMFIHFGLWTLTPRVTYEKAELEELMRQFDPKELDTDQWVDVAEAMGAKYIVFTAKHGDGFCMWQTDSSDFSIKSTPWRGGKGDILADLSASCRKRGMKLGVYINARNAWYGARDSGKCGTPEAQARYNKIYRRQLTEVLSRYGDMCEVWFDGGVNPALEVGDILKEHAPNAVVFGSRYMSIRWVGHEAGFAPYPAWNGSTQSETYGTRHSSPDGKYWLPLECDARIRASWMWRADNVHTLKSVDYLVDMYYRSVGHGAVLLLNHTPDPTGLIPKSDAKRGAEFGAEIRRRFGMSLAETDGAAATENGSIVELDLGESSIIDHVITMEDITHGERIRDYVLEGHSKGTWSVIAEGSAIGHKRIDPVEPVRVSRVRIRVTKSAARPFIRKLAAYRATSEAPFDPEPPSETPVGHWKLDDATGALAVDSSGKRRPGRIHGASPSEGIDGKSLRFDGEDDYVSLGDLDLFVGDFTVSAWVHPRVTFTETGFVLAKERNGVSANQCRLYVTAGNRLGFAFSDKKRGGVWPFESEQTVAPAMWSHIALTRAGRDLRLYINGAPVARMAAQLVRHRNDVELRIGAGSAATGSLPLYVFDGRIDDVRIYNRGSSAEEIARLSVER